MAHLIQPISIEGTLYCPSYLGRRMSEGVVTSDYVGFANSAEISNLESPWMLTQLADLAPDNLTGAGEISFGVACGSTITVQFHVADVSTDPDYLATIDVYVNGVFSDTLAFTSAGAPSPFDIDVSDLACGNKITLHCSVERADFADSKDGFLYLTAEVVSIS